MFNADRLMLGGRRINTSEMQQQHMNLSFESPFEQHTIQARQRKSCGTISVSPEGDGTNGGEQPSADPLSSELLLAGLGGGVILLLLIVLLAT
jgi:hypothetical protein